VTERGRREYAEVMRQRYQQARRQERGALLDEYCRVTRGHRKAAIRRLGAPARGRGRRPGRPARYGAALLPLLERVWLASDQLSGKLLHPILPALVSALERHHGAVIAPAARSALLAASPATLDRLLRPLRRRRPRQPRRLAPAVGSLRAQIPLRTWSEWTGVRPGALQGDLVLQHNFFRPVRKLLRKHRAGSTVRKRYDAPQTPYQRVLAAGVLTPMERTTLVTQFEALDPIALARQLEETLGLVWKLADPRHLRQETARG
jgi:hypothetical protein